MRACVSVAQTCPVFAQGELVLAVLEDNDINVRCRAIVDAICRHPYRYSVARPRCAAFVAVAACPPPPLLSLARALSLALMHDLHSRIFRAKDAGERAFYDMLVEDAKNRQASYVDFLCNIHRHIQRINSK